MSVNSYLTSLASTLVLSENEKLSIATSISTLSSRLNSHFVGTITTHFQFGSSTRGTILPRKADQSSDIDYMVVFNTSNGQMQPQTYLNNLRRFVESKYSRSEIYQSHPTIVLSLNHINFELVPAINNYGYQIPSPASHWIEWTSTDPSGINQLLQKKNIANGSQIKPLVRLIKYWNTKNGKPFNSFSIEEYIISRSFWGCVNLKDYFYDFWSGFSYSYDIAQYKKDMVDRAKQYAKQAKDYESSNMPICAELEITKIVPSL
jgi:Second Messenger Oligonucleotide or Dinucleotide Synthetase domain